MKIKSNGLRWGSYVLAGILFRLSVSFIFGFSGAKARLTIIDFVLTIGLIVALLEGLRWINRKIDRQVLWTESPFRRFFLQLGISLLFTIGITTFFDWAYPYFVLKIPAYREWNLPAIWPEILVSNIFTVLLISSIIGVESGSMFLKKWKDSLVELERFKKDTILSQFEVLKTQINPHFLFNSLNSLSSLIYADQNAAAIFIRKLSIVYRYVLENKDKETIKLGEELKIL